MAERLAALFIFSNPQDHHVLTDVVARQGLEPRFLSGTSEVKTALLRERIPLVFCEARLRDGDFRDVLQLTQSTGQKIPVVIASPCSDTGHYLEVMQAGAFDFIAWPYRRAEVEWIVNNALQKIRSDVALQDKSAVRAAAGK